MSRESGKKDGDEYNNNWQMVLCTTMGSVRKLHVSKWDPTVVIRLCGSANIFVIHHKFVSKNPEMRDWRCWVQVALKWETEIILADLRLGTFVDLPCQKYMTVSNYGKPQATENEVRVLGDGYCNLDCLTA